MEVVGLPLSPLGCSLGDRDGEVLELSSGDCEGDRLGLELGSILDGTPVLVGSELGLELGDDEGLALGVLLGVLEGEALGDDEGVAP